MSYEPTKWQTGDIITLNKLNKLEQGVAAMIEEYQPTVWQIGDTVTSTKLNKLEQAVATLSENSGGSLGAGHRIAGANGKLVNAFATRPDDMLTAQPNISFTAGSAGYVMLPAGVYACVMAEQNSTVIDDENNVIESEIVEMGQGAMTHYFICFVMPDADVAIE